MIRDALIPLLMQRFPNCFVLADPREEPFATFPAKHPAVGDVQIFDDGEEITLVAGNFTHGHFSNYEEIPTAEKELRIAEDVADFLSKLFSDLVILWGSNKGMGGWCVITSGLPGTSWHRNAHVWSGPLNN